MKRDEVSVAQEMQPLRNDYHLDRAQRKQRRLNAVGRWCSFLSSSKAPLKNVDWAATGNTSAITINGLDHKSAFGVVRKYTEL